MHVSNNLELNFKLWGEKKKEVLIPRHTHNDTTWSLRSGFLKGKGLYHSLMFNLNVNCKSKTKIESVQDVRSQFNFKKVTTIEYSRTMSPNLSY